VAAPEASWQGRRGLGWLTARPIAHRGYHDRAAGRIENTYSAFAAAIERSFAIECDLRLTSDEEVIVFHDETLDRLTDGGGQPERLPLSTIRALNINGTSDRIPTLRDLLEQVAGRVPLVVELKSLWTGDRRLERVVADTLADYAGPVAVMSFDPASMRAMRAYLPHLPRGMLADRFDEASGWEKLPALYRFAYRNLLLAPWVAPQFLAYDVKALPANAPLLIRHAFGLPLLTWTVRTVEERALAKRWADQIIFETFDPDR
jgi:glycerophosphoryl diester phosphodiesterase